MKRAVRFAILLLLLCLSLSPGVYGFAVARIEKSAGGLVSHVPIAILSDSDFLKPAEISGVVAGRGTSEDPYVIEGWRIDATQAEPIGVGPSAVIRSGIIISGTFSHFLIRNVWVSGEGRSGIILWHVQHGTVQDSRLTTTGNGILVGDSPGGQILSGTGVLTEGNVIAGSFFGIRFVSSSGGTIRDNVLRHTNVPISFGSAANQLTIIRNLIVDTHSPSDGAISGRTSESVIEENVIVGGVMGIVFENDSVSNIVSRNRIMVSSFGIRLFESHRNSVSENVILGANVGIFLVTISHGNLVSRNVIRDAAWYAILVHGTEGETNLLEANEVKDSPRGIWVLNSKDNVVRGNRFQDSLFPVGVFCILRPSSNNNVIGDNELVDVGVPSIVRPDVCFDFRFRFFPPPPLWSLEALVTSASSELRVLDSNIAVLDPDTGNSATGLDWDAFLPGTVVIRDLILHNNSPVALSITITDSLPEAYGRLLTLRSGNGFFFFLPLPETLTLQAGQERFVRFAWEVSLDAPIEPVTFDITLEGA